ncbi:tyrosine-type recombinase/integrase [Paenibacillus alginolyticus]|uniref:tyrosine-type recombinase/integrase n=1 Tax=Paenibacillus alginolyticus TaxID=59839 RepID=UPI0004134B80|nr:tyrosine-type recombinase/integrase [Paenibacillus alginolyticus]MCY9666449.1 tyrosine-type recombinase/integrase [Paenibacillus alginolyticus]
MNSIIPLDESMIFSTTLLSSGIDDNQLVHTLIDMNHYISLREIVSSEEDEEGNYDYSGVSNLGMVYLYVHNPEKERKDKTKEDYLRVLIAFLQYVMAIGKDDIRHLSRFDMETFQSHLEMQYTKSTTRAKKVVIIYSFLSWCFEEGYLKKKVTRGLRSVKKKKEEIPERDVDEADLKQAIGFYRENPKVQSLLLLLGTSGMRLNEVITPRWGDLYFDRREKKHYLVTITKRDKKRHVHIKEYVLASLMEYRKRVGLSTELNGEDETAFYPNRLGRRYNLSSLSTYLSKCMVVAGLTTIQGHRVTPHYMRHFYAQTAFANGAPLDWISETIGHSSTKITKENYLSRQLKKERDVSDYVDLEL